MITIIDVFVKGVNVTSPCQPTAAVVHDLAGMPLAKYSGNGGYASQHYIRESHGEEGRE